MRGTMLYAPGDVRFEDRPDPAIRRPTDAILRLTAACVCGSDLWSYRGVNEVKRPVAMGHEYCGVVEEVGSDVTTVRPGDFVIGSFIASDNTCPICRAGYQSACVDREGVSGAQAELMRVPLADGTLVATDGQPAEDLIPSLLTLSDVMGTGWFAAVAAGVRPGVTAVVVGDGAVGLCGVIAARELGAERTVAMSRHADRQALASAFGATDIVTERGESGVAVIKELTDGLGAESVLECVGTGESMKQAIASARPGGAVGFVGVPHGVIIDGSDLFRSYVRVHGAPAPVRSYLPDLIERVYDGRIDPGRVFDLTLPMERVAEGYRAMDERTAIKALLLP